MTGGRDVDLDREQTLVEIGKLQSQVGSLRDRMDHFGQVCTACRGTVNGKMGGVADRVGQVEVGLAELKGMLQGELAAVAGEFSTVKATVRIYAGIGTGVGTLIGSALVGFILKSI